MEDFDRLKQQRDDIEKRARRKLLSHSEAVDTWERVFWKWVRRGEDRSYAAWMADEAERRSKTKRDSETWPCSDCGATIPKGDRMCPQCVERQEYDERMEEAHPEWRCPPRE